MKCLYTKGLRLNLFLASTSPRRRELLAQLGLPFTALDVVIDESRRPQEPVASYVERMAKEKAEAGLQMLDDPAGALVLAADTVVALEDELLEKPVSREQAGAMLRSLSGRSHVVMTAFALKTAGCIRVQRVSTTVFFRNVLEREVGWYWETGEQQDKAGGYGIQGRGGLFVSSIAGSYTNVVGLPMAEVVMALREAGLEFVG